MKVFRIFNPALNSILGALLFAFCLPVEAQQQPGKIPRIGYLVVTSASAMSDRTEAFRQGLRELGYVEGKNIVIESRYGDGKLDRATALAAELVRLKVDVIVTGGTTDARAAKEATSTIPIVMAQDNDPVGNGFVASLARPGGNITGLSSYTTALNGKRLELLKEILPRLARVAVLGTSTNGGNAQALKETEQAADAFGVKVQYLDVRETKEIETAFRTARKERAEAILMLATPLLFNFDRKQFAELAVRPASQ